MSYSDVVITQLSLADTHPICKCGHKRFLHGDGLHVCYGLTLGKVSEEACSCVRYEPEIDE